MQRKAQMIKECLRQEIAVFCLNMASQVHLLAKVNGLLVKEYAMVPKEKGECLDSNLSDSWMAQYINQYLEVIYQKIYENSEPPALLNIKIQADLSCIRFDCANRLWMCSQAGFVEILDVRRSVKNLYPTKYMCFKLLDKIIHSRPSSPVSGKMLKTNQFKTFMAAKKGNSAIEVFKCNTKGKPELVRSLTNLADNSRSS